MTTSRPPMPTAQRRYSGAGGSGAHGATGRAWLRLAIAGCSAAGLASFVGAFVDGAVVPKGAGFELPLRTMLGVLTAALVVGAYRLTRRLSSGTVASMAPVSRALHRDSPELPPSTDIDRQVFQFHARHLNESAQLFTSVLIDSRYWLKLEEFITLGNGRARSRSRAQFQFGRQELRDVAAAAHRLSPDDGLLKPRLLLPLMVLRKGELLDDLDITDSSGNRLTVLALDDRIAAISATLVGLFAFTYFDSSDSRHEFVERLGRVRGDTASAADRADRHILLFRELERQVCVTKRVTPTSVARYFDDAQAAHSVEAVAERRAGELREFCVAVAEHYILMIEAPLPDGCNLSIEYTRSRSLDLEPGTRGTSFVAERLRRFFGLEPSAFRLPVNPTGRFTNYHAELNISTIGQYVWRQDLLLTDDRTTPGDHDGDARAGSRTRVTLSADSDAHPHLYLDASDRSRAPASIRWFLELSEVPPGALAPVFAMAASATLIFGTFTFFVPRLQVASNGLLTIDADAAALIVTIPLFTLTVFGYSLERMLKSSLVAVFGFIGTGILVVIAAISLLVADPALIADGATIFGRTFYFPLMLCTLASLTITVYVMIGWLLRLRRYIDRDRGEREFYVWLEDDRVAGGRR
ncbi:MAG: hypothetical protein ACT4RN_09455 [Pseudonocardia sp.]